MKIYSIRNIVRAATTVTGGIRPSAIAAINLYRLQGWQGIKTALRHLSDTRVSVPHQSSTASKTVSDVHAWLSVEVAKAIQNDPRIGTVPLEHRLGMPLLVPLRNSMGNCLELDIAALPSGVRQTFIFWVDQLVTGGSNTFALNVAREILRLRPESEVLFIQTGGAKPGQLEQVELGVNLYTPAGNSANLGANQLTAYYYYLALAAKGKANIALGSPGFWETCEVYGEALKTSTRLGAAFFCSDFDDLGYDRGYSAQYFETLIGTFDFVLTDNESHVAELIDLYGVSKDFLAKVHVLFHPLPGAMGPRKPIDKVQKILWAGRFSRQKGINTLSEIARAMPELTFYIYGGSKSQFTSSTWPNMVFCGEYKAFSECLTSAPDLYLNTSLWDGRQIVLLEAIFHGLPVVTSAVGGIGEIVKYPNTGCQVVASPADPSEYIDILRQTAMSPESVDFRPNEKPDQLLAHHGVKEYSMRISNLLDALGI